MHHYTIVDSFTQVPLAGNPVAVFLDCDDLAGDTMQALAAETHLSESTFVCSPVADGHARVRIFTPVNELAFAGHPLLGTALVLAERLSLKSLQIETGKGTFEFTVQPEGQNEDPLVAAVEMEQPSPRHGAYQRTAGLLDALGVDRSILPVHIYDVGPRHVFVGVDDVKALSAIRPDYRALADLPNMAAVCFAREGDSWRLRMFSPAYGVTEDAATGPPSGSPPALSSSSPIKEDL
jgi:trans-2,3-dihydro-3-hydroxyanthranilate isomerase